MGIGTKIKKARTDRGITQEKAAETLMVSKLFAILYLDKVKEQIGVS